MGVVRLVEEIRPSSPPPLYQLDRQYRSRNEFRLKHTDQITINLLVKRLDNYRRSAGQGEKECGL